MTKSFEQLLYLFGAASLGKDVAFDSEIDIKKIRKLAIEQGVWTIIYDKLQKLCDVSKYNSEFFTAVAKSIRKTEFTSALLRELEKKGISCCLLKGTAVSRLYHQPECRISGDTDILINPKHEKKVIKLLVENGYKVEERGPLDHHLKAVHPIGGLLEVHVRLYSRVTEQVVFNGSISYREPYHTIEINGHPYKTLGINDGLFYLTAHYIKHLVTGGGGIRQMMDLLLYMEHYKSEINFEKYFSVLRNLKYEKLVKVIMSIGAKYFGFDYEITNEVLMQEIIDDTEHSGLFCFSSEDRKRFHGEYCSNRTHWSKLHSWMFTALTPETTVFRVFFPTRATMEKQGYHDKFLLIAWIKRWTKLFSRRSVTQAQSQNDNVASRMELMKRLNMIEQEK